MGRRRPTRWQLARGPLGRLLAFPLTVWRVCFDGQFFERLPTQQQPPAGRRFFIWNWLLLSAVAIVLFALVDHAIVDE